MTRADAAWRYQPFYCEENVWWLVRETEGRCWAVFITNAARRVILWQQRLAPPEEPVLWDYHVVMLEEADGRKWVRDLDTRLPSRCPAHVYLDETFPFCPEALPEGLTPFVPRFRVVSANALAATFSSDRRHMRSRDGDFIHPPPAWEPPTALEDDAPTTLERYLDLTDPIAGEVMDLAALRTWVE